MNKKKKLMNLLILGCILVTVATQYNFGKIYENIIMVSYEEADSYIVLVNKNHKLEPDYSPSDLVLLNTLDFNQNPNTTIYMRATAAHMAEELFRTALDEAGFWILARSGYRSYQTQAKLYERYVSEHGQVAADRFSARPGHSEHQTGLALDVTSSSVNGQLIEEFGNSPEGKWLRDNAHRFGFIIRYPEGRESETGYIYEPWHIRYVGIEAATKIYQQDWILEQYLSQGRE